MNFTIELSTNPTDFEICAKMMSISDPWITLGFDFEACLLAFEGFGKEIYVIKIENEIAGFVVLQIFGTFKGYIQTICIDETFRGKGLGISLLQFCEERILKISPNIFICVSDFNEGAIKLYSKFGFEKVGELKDFVKKGFTEILMRKTFGEIFGYQMK